MLSTSAYARKLKRRQEAARMVAAEYEAANERLHAELRASAARENEVAHERLMGSLANVREREHALDEAHERHASYEAFGPDVTIADYVATARAYRSGDLDEFKVDRSARVYRGVGVGNFPKEPTKREAVSLPEDGGTRSHWMKRV